MAVYQLLLMLSTRVRTCSRGSVINGHFVYSKADEGSTAGTALLRAPLVVWVLARRARLLAIQLRKPQA